MEINKDIIERYHMGLCNPRETEAVQAWLKSDQVDMTFLEEQELNELENTGWKKLTERYDLLPEVPVLTTRQKTRNIGFSWQIAASIAVLLGLGAAYLFFNPTLLSQQKKETELSYEKIQTPKGQKLQVTLPDGTQVWMNAESTLRFPRQFSQSQRAISFSGEGYFKVAKNPNKPFVITSNHTKIQVLGTRFNLRDYPGEPSSAVVVEEGKVRFSGLTSAAHLILTANQKGTYSADINPALVAEAVYNTNKYIDWTENKLVLDNLTLTEIVPILERWYGIKLTINYAKLNNKRYTGSFENTGLQQVIASICFALKCNYQQQGQTWIITK